MPLQTSTKPVADIAPKSQTGTKQVTLPLILVTTIFVATNILWSFFDHGLPDWDAAGHLLNGLAYRDLLKHPHFTTTWLYEFLSVNYLYPPAVYIFSGTVKLLLGISPWVDGLTKAIYQALLCISIYKISQSLLKDQLAAVIAVIVINLYPGVSFYSNLLMLDFPTLSMVALALWALINWQTKPSIRNTILLGLAIGLACMTKQLSGAFLVFPVALIFGQKLFAKHFSALGKLVLAGLIPACMSLPWLIATYPSLQQLAQYNTNAFGNIGTSLGFGSNLVSYLSGFPSTMSPTLLCGFIASVVVVGSKTHRALLLLSASSLGGLIMLSMLSWAFPLDRYAMPALIMPAVYTGAAFSRAWSHRSTLFLKASYAVLAFVAISQYLVFNFSPYPVPIPETVAKALPYVGVKLQTYHNLHIPPCPEKSDWGHAWILSQIRTVDKEMPVYLQIMPNSRTFNVHTMDYAAKLKKSPVISTTMRQWSVAGDTMEFSPQKAMYCHWYLIKTGDQGNIFANKESQIAFDRLTQFVQTSGKFRLMGMRSLPDNSICYLYRQTF